MLSCPPPFSSAVVNRVARDPTGAPTPAARRKATGCIAFWKGTLRPDTTAVLECKLS